MNLPAGKAPRLFLASEARDTDRYPPKSDFIPVMSTTFGVQRSKVNTQGRTERPGVVLAQEASMTTEKTKADDQRSVRPCVFTFDR